MVLLKNLTKGDFPTYKRRKMIVPYENTAPNCFEFL